jgi:hypothetical protein
MDDKGDLDFKKLWTTSQTVVHAKVIGLNGSRQARVDVIETFKGQGPKILKGLDAAPAACGWKFRVGDEELFFVRGGEVNLCSRSPVSGERVERLRALQR